MPTGGERRATNVNRSSISAAKADRLSSPATASERSSAPVFGNVPRHLSSR
jgi:hypothetical protein